MKNLLLASPSVVTLSTALTPPATALEQPTGEVQQTMNKQNTQNDSYERERQQTIQKLDQMFEQQRQQMMTELNARLDQMHQEMVKIVNERFNQAREQRLNM